MRSRPTLAGLAWTLAAMLATVSTAALVQAAEVRPGDRSEYESEVSLRAGGGKTFSQSLVNLMPGDAVTQTILVGNDGTAELRYSLSISSEDPDGKRLRDVLAVTIWTADGASTRSCWVLDGPALYSGSLRADGGFGDPEAGADRGDRRLGPGTTEVLCLRMTLPLKTDNAYQGARTTASFTVTAEQTRDNR